VSCDRRRLQRCDETRSGDQRGLHGKLFAQIENGAPFEGSCPPMPRDRQLEERGHSVAEAVRVRTGRLALWSPREDFVRDASVLRGDAFQHLAIANPELAPYGAAARDVLQHLGLWERVQPKLVRGEDIGQTFQFVSTGNAELGFVALSQLTPDRGGSRWLVPPSLYVPIEQQAVLLLPV
jgi:molybdate transport system substrate-binding protein